MYYSYVEIEYIATSFSPSRTDLALKLLNNKIMIRVQGCVQDYDVARLNGDLST